MTDKITIRVDPFPTADQLASLSIAWENNKWSGYLPGILERSLCHACAYATDRLVGYVNVAWDGGVHAFLLDTTVHPDFQRMGIATRLVAAVTEESCKRGAEWLHVDYDPHLETFYHSCGFQTTAAGLIRLK